MLKQSVIPAMKNGFSIALVMMLYALLLKLIDQQTGVSTIGYYLLFGVGIIIFTRQWMYKMGVAKFISQSGHLAMLSLFAGSLYAAWVVINTKLIIGGPIPALVQNLESLKIKQNNGEDVTKQIETVSRYIDSPEIFAANTGTILFLFGLIVGIPTILFLRRKLSKAAIAD